MANAVRWESPIQCVELLDFSSIKPFLQAVIRDRFESKKLASAISLEEQIFALWDKVPRGGRPNELTITQSTLAKCFGKSKGMIRRICIAMQKRADGVPQNPGFRTPK